MIFTEKSRTISIDSWNEAHGVQSDAEYGPSHNTGHRPFLRIGQWPAPTTSALAGTSIALETHVAIRRTGTDLQNEEINIGTGGSRTVSDNNTQSETEAAKVSHPQDTSSAENADQSKDSGPNLSLHYYQFEWFRILIGMMFLMVSDVITHGLVIVTFTANVVALWLNVIISVAVGIFLLLLYTSVFVVLMEYREAIEKFLDKHAHSRPRLQHKFLRGFAYVYACSIIVVIAFINVFFNYYQ